jgi:hypothetical protein
LAPNSPTLATISLINLPLVGSSPKNYWWAKFSYLTIFKNYLMFPLYFYWSTLEINWYNWFCYAYNDSMSVRPNSLFLNSSVLLKIFIVGYLNFYYSYSAHLVSILKMVESLISSSPSSIYSFVNFLTFDESLEFT